MVCDFNDLLRYFVLYRNVVVMCDEFRYNFSCADDKVILVVIVIIVDVCHASGSIIKTILCCIVPVLLLCSAKIDLPY